MLRPNDLLAENKDQSQRFSSSTNYWQGWSRTYNLWVLNICQSSSLHKLLDKVGRLQIFRDKFFTLLRKLSDSPIQENPIRFFFIEKVVTNPPSSLIKVTVNWELGSVGVVDHTCYKLLLLLYLTCYNTLICHTITVV